MKTLLPLLLATLAACGCGPLTVTGPATPGPDTSAVVSVIGRFVAGCHVCPVGEREALTAAHCVDLRPFDSGVPAFGLRGEAPNGWRGSFTGDALMSFTADVATLRPSPAFTHWYRRGARPTRGDVVSVVGWSRSGDDPLGRRVVLGKVTSVTAGHLGLTAYAGPGSSGGCVLSAAGEVVGIVTMAVTIGIEKYATVAAGVWQEVGDDEQ